MKARMIAIAFALLAGCSAQTAPVAPGSEFSTICADVARVQAAPGVMSLITAQDPKSAFGVVWTYVSSSCNGPAPVTGVSPTWQASVWAMVKALAPVVLPAIVGLL